MREQTANDVQRGGHGKLARHAPDVNARALAAAGANAVLLAGTTAPSALFVAYRQSWGLTTADLGVVFASYVGTLLPALFVLGGLADRIGRRGAIALGLTLAIAGLATLILAGDRTGLIAARLLQGTAVGIASGAVTAALAEAYSGRLSAGMWTAIASNTGLLAGALITALSFDLGTGLRAAYTPLVVVTLASLALLPLHSGRPTVRTSGSETRLEDGIVARTLAFALPSTFVCWSGFSLFLSMVPAYIAATLQARDPLVAAGVISALQLASIGGTLRYGRAEPLRASQFACAGVVAGLALLIAGTSAGGALAWTLVAAATILVGACGGVGFASALALAARVGRGRRARIFSWLYVAAYLGFGTPSLVVGFVAARSSLAAGFIGATVALAAATIALPLLRARVIPVPATAPA